MKKNTGDFKTDLEQLLQEGNIIRLKPQGFSMYPLFIPGRDEALIQQVPVTSLKRNDVALYRRDQGILVLHRIVRVTADGYYMTGDNQYEIEGPLRPDQFRGKRIYTSPEVMELREYCKKEQNTLWDESRRLVNPQKVYVDLSQKLYDIKKNLLEEMSEKALD